MAKKSDSQKTTPVMQQYQSLKAECGEALLFFRMGDFYELFNQDAEIASHVLGITLTARDKNKENPIPMAGVPHHAAENYIQKLLDAGYKVAIGEQLTDPAATKGIVERGIVRTFTPAIQFKNDACLESQYLGVLFPVKEKESIFAFAALDPSTGETLIGDPCSLDDLSSLVSPYSIKHLLLPALEVPSSVKNLFQKNQTLIELVSPNYVSEEVGRKILEKQFHLKNIDGFLPHSHLIQALSLAILYATKSQKVESLPHLQLPKPLRKSDQLIYGPQSIEHLDLLPETGSNRGKPNLFDVINRTKTSLGNRKLRSWLTSPLTDLNQIKLRQKAIFALHSNDRLRRGLRENLGKIYDLERILGRIHTLLVTPRDTYALASSLESVSEWPDLLKKGNDPHLSQVGERIDKGYAKIRDLLHEILHHQKDDPPHLSRDGGIFQMGYRPELDELLEISENGKNWLLKLEKEEREKTSIPSLKVKYNRVFGYFIEVTKTHLKNVPDHYQRKQSTVNAERFFTEELKEFEDKILNANTRLKTLEQTLFEDLVSRLASVTKEIQTLAEQISELDSLQSLSQLKDRVGWCFPNIDESHDLEIHSGRHPMVDQREDGKFIPNDTHLGPSTQNTLLITGPNMGGKSTVMRQVATIVILGQMGAPVPAKSAQWGLFHSIYTRIGAHDAIAQGQSTFMVEMNELAHILHHANERSLIILDEIGRGTSTYDGMSVAWSTLEWITQKVKARTLFATHYHELTHLQEKLPSLSNAHMAVEGSKALEGENLRFLYKLRPGAVNDSFGIQVAQLAGVPSPVIARAWEVLQRMEKESAQEGWEENVTPPQLDLFSSQAKASQPDLSEGSEKSSENWTPKGLTVTENQFELIEELVDIDVNSLTPIEALNYLSKAKDRIS